MIRRAIALLLASAGLVSAQTILWTTNDITAPDGPGIELPRGTVLRFTVTATDGPTNPYSLSVRTCQWVLVSAVDGEPLATVTTRTISGTSGIVRAAYTFGQSGRYLATMLAYHSGTGGVAATLARNVIMVTTPETVINATSSVVFSSGAIQNQTTITNFVTITNTITTTNTYTINVTNEIQGSTFITTNYVVLTNSIVVTNNINASVNVAGVIVTNTILMDDSWEVDLGGSLQPVSHHAGRALVPRDANTSSVGTPDKPWRTGVFDYIIIEDVEIPPIPKPTSASAMVLQWSGTDAGSVLYWGNVNGPTPALVTGTNIVTWSNAVASGPAATWTVPAGITNVEWTVGAGGGGGANNAAALGGAAGLAVAYQSVIPGSQWDIYVANGGKYSSSTNAFPGGGAAKMVGGSMAGGGGAFSAVQKAGSLNFDWSNMVVVSAGGGGGAASGQAVPGGPGGGISGGPGIASVGSNVAAGAATALDQYGLSATSGTGGLSAANGTRFVGGNAATNPLISLPNYSLGGGGAGLESGAAGSITATNVTPACSGAGGLSAINTNYAVGWTVRGSGRIPPAQDWPYVMPDRGWGGESTKDGSNGFVRVRY